MSRSDTMTNLKEWDRHAILAAIHRKGETLATLAEKTDVTRRGLSVALGTPYPKADRVISKFLGVPLHELWPDRYDASGQRITLRRPPMHLRQPEKPARRKKPSAA